MPESALHRTALYDLHLERGGRMVPFAGYEMPVRFEPGPVAEHHHTRRAASVFDVSHMRIVELIGTGAHEALEALVPAAIATLGVGRMRYTMLTNEHGGVIDDLMVTNDGPGRVTLVVNAALRESDVVHLRAEIGAHVEVVPRDDLALVAFQGPAAVTVLARHDPSVAELTFMRTGRARLAGFEVGISRSGYTGEDGFEITASVSDVAALVAALLDEPEVEPAGLAARDSLRLEAGMCLYGHDLDTDTNPIEAGLAWSIQKARREAGGFPGAAVIQSQLADGPPRHRVGIRPLGRKPVREGAVLASVDGTTIGVVTSGGFGPSVDNDTGAPIAMGYVATGHEAIGTSVIADVRGTDVPCAVADLPFVPHRYVR